jgi:hypothetical protein
MSFDMTKRVASETVISITTTQAGWVSLRERFRNPFTALYAHEEAGRPLGLFRFIMDDKNIHHCEGVNPVRKGRVLTRSFLLGIVWNACTFPMVIPAINGKAF